MKDGCQRLCRILRVHRLGGVACGAVLAVCACFLGALPGWAAEAAFSADGKAVYFFNQWDRTRPNEPVELNELTIQSKAVRKIDLVTLKPPGGFIAIDRWGDKLLLLTGRVLFAYDPSTGVSSIVCEAPEDEGFENVAADPKTGNILITGFVKPGREDRLGWYFLKGSGNLLLVTARRIESLEAPTFGPDGVLYFGVLGDLWAGRIDLGEQSDETRDSISVVEAVRIAPLASLETGDFTPAAQGVRGIAVAADGLYVIVYRMGGSGDGSLVRLPTPFNPLRALANYPATLSMYGGLLSGAKVLEQSNFRRMPCASPSGDRVFYGRGGPELVVRRVTDGTVDTLVPAP